MCIGGGGGSPPPSAPPPAPPPAPTPVTARRIQPRKKTKVTREGAKRKIGTARGGLVIRRKTTGVQYTAGGSGVNM